ncbi:ParB N-terminal domain-containing protein [Streptosporangium sp. NPDC002721]|uniref:ParB N-terminal domain-containing protein n=1 Tax=Streptosporangium sp. NPDC002721 TaxID=3366188 RepID=UPI0036BB270F
MEAGPQEEREAESLVGGESRLVHRAATSASSRTGQTAKEASDEDYRSTLSEVESVPVRSLLSADTPRSMGEDPQHIRLLFSVEAALPPVIVHRPTMRVVDGMHRLRAAMLRGDTNIRVRFFDGDEHDAFVIAVRENIAHGLPLSAADRAAAAGRIVRSHPHWSDRMVGKVAGLSARTVGNVRRSVSTGNAQPVSRLGDDGRIRPLDSSAGRIRAAELMVEEPHASLRRIARQAGISPNTVRDVRDRLERGESPLPRSSRSADARPDAAPHARPATSGGSLPGAASEVRSPEAGGDRRRTSPLHTLIRDPAMRSGERGRLLLRMLSMSDALTPDREQLIDAVPEHCVDLVCQAVKESAAAWAEFAGRVERRAAGLKG